MSGTRLTRKVTVEGTKKVAEQNINPRRLSVFERLGPGAAERPQSRENYQEKCRNWLREGRCAYGNKCKFLHGPFSDPKQRTKSVISVVRSDQKERPDDRDEEHHRKRTRSLDSNDAEDEDVRQVHHGKRKHKTDESPPRDVQRERKVKKRHRSNSAEGIEEEERSKVHKQKAIRKRDVGPLVVTKPGRPLKESSEWKGWGEEVNSPNEERGLDWEDQGELDFQKQLELEKRRQHIKRELALMDQEDAQNDEIPEGSSSHDKEVTRHVPTVHSRLHPAPSLSTIESEMSQPPVQPVKTKKKKKVDQKVKKSKKLKTSPTEKNGRKSKILQENFEDARPRVDDQKRERVRKISSSGSESARIQSKGGLYTQAIESDGEERTIVMEHQGTDKFGVRQEIVQHVSQEERLPQQKMHLQHEHPRSKNRLGSEKLKVKDKPVKRKAAISPRKGQHFQGEESSQRTSDPSDEFSIHSSQAFSPSYDPQYDSRDEGSDRQSPRKPVRDIRQKQEMREIRGEDEKPYRRHGPPPGARNLRTPSPEVVPHEAREEQYGMTDRRKKREWAQSPSGPSENDRQGKWKSREKPLKEKIKDQQSVEPKHRHHRTSQLSEDEGSQLPFARSRQQVFSDEDEQDLERRERYHEKEHSFDAHETQLRRYKREEPLQRMEHHHEPPNPEYQRSRGRGDRGKETFHRQGGPSSGVDDYHRGERGRLQDNEEEDYPSAEDREERFKEYHKGQERVVNISKKLRRPGDQREEERVKSQSRDSSRSRQPREQEDREEYRQRELPPEELDDYSSPPPPRGRPKQGHEEEPLRGKSRQETQIEEGKRTDRSYSQRVPHGEGERNSQRIPHGEGERRFEGRNRHDIQHGDDRQRPDFQERDHSRERFGERGHEVRSGQENYRHHSPSPQGMPRPTPPGVQRARTPPHRRSYSPHRRDEGFRQGPPPPREQERQRGGPVPGQRGPGRGGYPVPYDNRTGRVGENRRRGFSPPPGRQFPDRGRNMNRMRDPPPGGRGRPYGDSRGRPIDDRYRDSPGSWERRHEYGRDRGRQYPESHNLEGRPGDRRDSRGRPRDAASPERRERPWEEREGSPGRGPSPYREHRRPAYEEGRVEKGRPGAKGEVRRPAGEDDVESQHEEDNQKATENRRKRVREDVPASKSEESPIEIKKARSISSEVGDISAATDEGSEQPNKTKAVKPSPVVVKEGKKVKKKKESKEGKHAKASSKAAVAEESEKTQDEPPQKAAQNIQEAVPSVGKKQKKEKGKGKEKTGKKKTKKAAAVSETKKTDDITIPTKTEVIAETIEPVISDATPEVNTAAPEQTSPKVKEEQETQQGAVEGVEMEKLKEDEKPKKKKKKKHLPEVVVQPWADLEEQEEQRVAEEQQKHEPLVKRIEEVFSDWSDDDSPGGDAWFDDNDTGFAQNESMGSEEHQTQKNSHSFDDVYDPISDDELDDLLGEDDDHGNDDEGQESKTVPAAVEDVDWSALVTIQSSDKRDGEEPGAHLRKFTPARIFERIGISTALAGPELRKQAQELCPDLLPESSDSQQPTMQGMCGALVAARAARRRQRQNLFTQIGPCRRALCARADLNIRKKLRQLSAKDGTKMNLFPAPPSAPMDNEMFLMSVALYKHEQQSSSLEVSANMDKLIPSRVGSVLISSRT